MTSSYATSYNFKQLFFASIFLTQYNDIQIFINFVGERITHLFCTVLNIVEHVPLGRTHYYLLSVCTHTDSGSCTNLSLAVLIDYQLFKKKKKRKKTTEII